MLRQFLIVLAVLMLTGVMIGCSESEKERHQHNAAVLGTDFRLMNRDMDTVLGLNRSGSYNRYDAPCYIDGH